MHQEYPHVKVQLLRRHNQDEYIQVLLAFPSGWIIILTVATLLIILIFFISDFIRHERQYIPFAIA